MLVESVAELAAFHHARQRDSDDALAGAGDLAGDRQSLVRKAPRDRRQSRPRPGDECVGGHPGVDVHRRGVQRAGAHLVVPGLHLHLAGRYGDDDDVAVPAGRVVVDAAGHHHDVIGDRRQRDELLDPADLVTVTRRTHFGADDLQIRPARGLRGADAQHRLTTDRLLADGAEVVVLGEPPQQRDGRIVQADTHADARRPQPAQLQRQGDEFRDVRLLAVTPLLGEHTGAAEVFDELARKPFRRFGFRGPGPHLVVEDAVQ